VGRTLLRELPFSPNAITPHARAYMVALATTDVVVEVVQQEHPVVRAPQSNRGTRTDLLPTGLPLGYVD
jgi:hypothetical protein